jgi:membrane protein DedA with SNARE-associated domain
MPELLFTCTLTAALFSCLTWYFTSRYYQRRMPEQRRPHP